MIKLLKKFYKDESGATMVEYAIMVALIAVAVAAVVILLSQQMNYLFNDVKLCLSSPSSANCQVGSSSSGG